MGWDDVDFHMNPHGKNEGKDKMVCKVNGWKMTAMQSHFSSVMKRKYLCWCLFLYYEWRLLMVTITRVVENPCQILQIEYNRLCIQNLTNLSLNWFITFEA